MRRITKRLSEFIVSVCGRFSSADAVLGGLAQPGERLLCKQEVSGSNPLVSIVLGHHVRNGKRALPAQHPGQ